MLHCTIPHLTPIPSVVKGLGKLFWCSAPSAAARRKKALRHKGLGPDRRPGAPLAGPSRSSADGQGKALRADALVDAGDLAFRGRGRRAADLAGGAGRVVAAVAVGIRGAELVAEEDRAG